MSEQQDKNRSCRGKKRHANLPNALKALRATGRVCGELTLVAYKCRHCDGYHLGHPHKAEQKRLHYNRLLRLIDYAVHN